MYQEEVVLYGVARSRSCRRARRLLKRKGYAFEEIDVGTEERLLVSLSEATGKTILQPLVFLRSQENFTVQLWLSFVSRVNNVGQPAIVMAGSVLASIPIVIMFVALQRHFIAGLTAGSTK